MLNQSLKRACLAVCCFMSLLSGLGGAQDSPSIYQVRVLTYPPDAQVYLDVSGKHHYEKFLGKTGDRILLDLRSLKGASGFTIIIRKEGYFDKRERISTGYFDTRDQYPEAGRIHLEPENWTIAAGEFLSLHRNTLIPLGVFVLLGLGTLYQVRKREKQRLSQLERVSSRTPGADPLLNTVLSGWRLVEVIGRGGNAVVYRALPDDTLDESRAVAVKVFSEESTGAAGFLDRFKREAKLYQQLDHPGIVRLLDWGQQGELFYLVMELVQGESLKPAGIRGAEGESEVLDILIGVASALAHAHDRGVIHRDVKPENVLRTHSGRVKLLDFGLAREVMSSFTKTGQALGTPLYMAPEQIRGAFVDHRCDQYSLGALAYELFTGQKTYETDEQSAAPILFKQLNQKPVPMSERVPVSEACEALVARLMEIRPDDRFENMNAVIEALKALRGK